MQNLRFRWKPGDQSQAKPPFRVVPLNPSGGSGGGDHALMLAALRGPAPAWTLSLIARGWAAGGAAVTPGVASSFWGFHLAENVWANGAGAGSLRAPRFDAAAPAVPPLPLRTSRSAIIERVQADNAHQRPQMHLAPGAARHRLVGLHDIPARVHGRRARTRTSGRFDEAIVGWTAWRRHAGAARHECRFGRSKSSRPIQPDDPALDLMLAAAAAAGCRRGRRRAGGLRSRWKARRAAIRGAKDTYAPRGCIISEPIYKNDRRPVLDARIARDCLRPHGLGHRWVHGTDSRCARTARR